MVTDDSMALGKVLAVRGMSTHLSQNLPNVSEKPMCNPSTTLQQQLNKQMLVLWSQID